MRECGKMRLIERKIKTKKCLKIHWILLKIKFIYIIIYNFAAFNNFFFFFIIIILNFGTYKQDRFLSG